jgi:hypothetical protein
MRTRTTAGAAALVLAIVLGGCGLPGGGQLFGGRLVLENVNDFGYLGVPGGTFTDAPMPVTVTNRGLGTATNLSISTTAPSASSTLTVANSTCTNLAPHESCTFDLLLTGTFTGDGQGSVTVGADAPTPAASHAVVVDVVIIGP